MGTAQNKYNSYALSTKLQLVRSGDPYFFAHQGIPRTTAIYWLENSQKYEEMHTQTEMLSDAKVKYLEAKIEIEKSLKNLLIKIRKLHPFSFDKKKVKSKSVKKQLIDALSSTSKLVPLKTCLEVAGISPSTYYRWLSVFQRCEISGKDCQK